MVEKEPKKTEKKVKAATVSSPPKEAAKAVVSPKPPPKEVVTAPLVPFERWFRVRAKQKEYKIHWIDGMKSYTDITKRRTMLEWDSVFAKY